MVRLRVKRLDLDANHNIAVLNEADARRLGIVPGSRVEIFDSQPVVAIVDTARTSVKQGEIGLFVDTWEALKVRDGEEVEVYPSPDPISVKHIRRKIIGEPLSEEAIRAIIDDIMEGRLTTAEAAAFVVSAYIRGLTLEETVALTKAIAESGEVVRLDKHPVVDKHCIGGVPNNRTTMLFVPIMASLGFYVPKTSSRAITSPAGTADTMEVLAPVDLSAEEIKEITESVGGVMAWGGGTRLAAADDKLIEIRRPLSLDPKGMLLASIMAKKLAVSAEYVLIDIPVGRGAKIADVRTGETLAKDFITLGHLLGMDVKVVITDGSAPIGRGVGPVLEARDVLEILMGSGPEDLREKALELVAESIAQVKGVETSAARKMAEDALSSGRALEKMRVIIEAQGGDPEVKPEDLKPGRYVLDVYADRDGKITHIDNRSVASIARMAGAPSMKGSGLYLHVRVGDRVKKGDLLYTVYSESPRLIRAVEEAGEAPITIE